MKYMYKIILISTLFFTSVLAIDNEAIESNDLNESNNTLVETIAVVKLKDEILLIDKSIKNNIWITKYRTYLAYRNIEDELAKIKKDLKKYSSKSAKKFKEITYQLNNKLKVKKNELALISQYKESPIGNSMKPKDIPMKPKINNPFNIIEAYTYIQKLNAFDRDYKKIYLELSELVRIIDAKIVIYEKLFLETHDEEVKEELEILKREFKDFIMVIDIVSTTSEVYVKKIIEVKLEVKSAINDEIERTIKLFFIMIILVVIAIAIKKGAKKYITVDDNQYTANKLINFTLIIIIVFILLFSYIDNASYLVTVLGFASAGIAIALKDWFMSIFGWMVIMTSGAIKVGDRIKVTKNTTEVVGDVLDITLFKIAVREDVTYTSYTVNRRSGRVFFIPNNYIFTELISNYSFDGIRTVWDGIDINITFDSNHKKANDIAKNIASAHSKGYTDLAKKRLSKLKLKYILRSISTEPKVFSMMESYGVVISIWYQTNSYATLGLRSTISMAILDAYKNEDDITIAYPTHTVHAAKNMTANEMISNDLNNKSLFDE